MIEADGSIKGLRLSGAPPADLIIVMVAVYVRCRVCARAGRLVGFSEGASWLIVVVTSAGFEFRSVHVERAKPVSDIIVCLIW